MMFMNAPRLLAAAAWLTFASAQTFLSTVPVPDGNTEVLSVSTDLVGNTVPIVVGTLTGPGTTPAATPGLTPTPTPAPGASTTPLATSAPAVTTTTPRVVGQPGPTGQVSDPIPQLLLI
ncbi:hypothetical protein FRC08_008687 [Ceratobasidium sp. 394]|nr:hypothetical protein FRC08_008687 [Ceratobasidium sp. 394]